MIFGGCPKRQTGPRIVYIPTPPPAASPSESTQAMVIQAPAPSVPAEVTPEPLPPAASVPAPQKQVHYRRPQVKGPAQEPVDIPALQPGLSPNQETALRDQVVKLQQGIENRISRLSREWLSSGQRSTLEGARGFLQQSERALQESDLKRAFNLAHKADLLVNSLEQSQ